MADSAHRDLVWRDRRSKEPRNTALRASGVSRETAEKLADAGHYSITIARSLDAWQWISDDPLAEWLCRIIITQHKEIEEMRSTIVSGEAIAMPTVRIRVDGGSDDV